MWCRSGSRSLGPTTCSRTFYFALICGLCLIVFDGYKVSALPATNDFANGTNNATTPVPMEMPPGL